MLHDTKRRDGPRRIGLRCPALVLPPRCTLARPDENSGLESRPKESELRKDDRKQGEKEPEAAVTYAATEIE